MSVARCQEEVDAREFARWLAMNNIDPWTSERDDIRAAMMPFTFSTAFAGKGRKPKLDDFVPKFGERTTSQEPSPNVVEAKLRQFIQLHNEAVKRG